MGLDHYLERPEELPADRFGAWARDVRKVIDALPPLLIRAPYSDDAPIITDSLVAFGGNRNYAVGYAEDALAIYADPLRLAQFVPKDEWDTDYVYPFHVARVFDQTTCQELTPGLLWDSFSLRGLPCEQAFISALILFAHHFEGMCRVGSDYPYRDWKEGLALAQRATGLSLIIPWFSRGWLRARLLPAENFRAWRDDVARVITMSGVPVAGPDGTGEPVLTDALVAFNGVDADGAEPLRFPREYIPVDRRHSWMSEGWFSGSVATEGNRGKRYDIVVAAALLLLSTHFPVPINPLVSVTEPVAAVRVYGGELGDEEWLPGLQLAANATGRTMSLPGM